MQSLLEATASGNVEVDAYEMDPVGESYGVSSARLWRFVDLGRRLDFLIAGFGWCRRSEHVVAGPISEGKLVPLMVEDDASPRDALAIYAAHRRDRVLGQAGRWLLDTLRDRLSAESAGDLN